MKYGSLANLPHRASVNYKDGVISVALDSDSPVKSVVLHEAVHRLREVNLSGYQQMASFIQSRMDAGQLNAAMKVQEKVYGTTDLDALSEETVADAFGTILNDSGLLEQFAREHTNALQRMADSIRDMVRKIRNDSSMEDLQLTDSEKAAFSSLANELAGMEKTMRNALRVVEKQSAGAYNQNNLRGKGQVQNDGVREEQAGGNRGVRRETDSGDRTKQQKIAYREGNQTDSGLRSELASSVGGQQRVEPSFGEKPHDAWVEGKTVNPAKGSVSYDAQQTAIGYNIPSFVVSESAWKANHEKAPAFSIGGQIYVVENAPERNRGMLAPHEITHIMKQTGFQPYLDFVKRTPDAINMSNPAAQIILERTAKHRDITMEQLSEAMSDAENGFQINGVATMFFDELNAMVYGHIASGKGIEMFAPGGVCANVFYDFDTYAKELTALHERFKAERNLSLRAESKGKFKLKAQENASINEMEQSLNELNEEYRSLEKQDAEFQTAPEYTALMDAISEGRASKKSLLDKPEALKQALDAYSAWQEESGYSDVIHRMEELRGDMKTLRGQLDSAKEQAVKEAKAAVRAGYSESMAKQYATKAARKFGTTNNFDLAGYLTVNGTLLDFSDRQGYRVRDHREITDVLDFLPEDHGYSDGMIEFMNLGNIRLQSYGIDISKAPNSAQRSMLRKFFQSKNGDVAVDFSDENGRSAGSLEYNRGTSADRILNDIDTYFETGGIPEQSVVSQFHGKFSKSRKAALEEYIREYGEAPNATEKAAMALLKENEQLREVNEGLKAQFKRTELAKVDKRKLNSFTKQLLKDYSSSVDIDDARTALDGLYTYLANGENGDSAVWENAYERAYAVAETILENSSVTNDELYREYETLRNDIKNTAIAIDASYVHDLGYESVSEFKKANRGKIRLDKNGVPVDTLYQSLVADEKNNGYSAFTEYPLSGLSLLPDGCPLRPFGLSRFDDHPARRQCVLYVSFTPSRKNTGGYTVRRRRALRPPAR